jgi:putative phage-type endonuclease
MKIVNLTQGSPEWHAFRAAHFTASDASAMLGLSKYKTRDQLLEEKVTGITEDVTPAKQVLFDKGHAAEAAARALLEEETGEDLFPVTGYHDDITELAASLDGMDMMGDEIFEHKLWNERLASFIATQKDLPDTHWPQVEHQLFVSGAERCRFVVSDGTAHRREILIYESKPGRRKKVIDGWSQFAKDLQNWKPSAKKAVTGAAVAGLPAPVVELAGQVTTSNLPTFRQHVEAMLTNIKTELTSDQDFADAEQIVKALKKGEEQLAAAKESALSRTVDIEEVFRTMNDLQEMLRQKRLQLEKLVKAEKVAVRERIIQARKEQLTAYIYSIQPRIRACLKSNLPTVDFEGAIKGKKTITSLESAANDELARAKIAIDSIASAISTNLESLDRQTAESGLATQVVHTLCADLPAIVAMPAAEFAATIDARIHRHIEAERARLQELQEQEAEKARQAAESASVRAELQSTNHPITETDHFFVGQTHSPDAPAQRLQDLPFTTGAAIKQAQHSSLRDALIQFCRARGLPGHDADELLEIVAGYQINLDVRAA